VKIAAFAQLHNELERGNLHNWFRSVEGCDVVYVYDQASTDGSRGVYEKRGASVIYSPVNDFNNERACRGDLLIKLLEEHPDVEWILWMDGDTILDGRLQKNGFEGLRELCAKGSADGVGAYLLGHYNLWRSDTWYRTDNLYHWLHGQGVCALWRNNGRLAFARNPGLHLPMEPGGLDRKLRVGYSLVHRGFATDDQLVWKHKNYKARGLSKKLLYRFVDESTLRVEKVPPEVLPEWYEVVDGGASPVGKPALSV
jgi:hypothetical protein